MPDRLSSLARQLEALPARLAAADVVRRRGTALRRRRQAAAGGAALAVVAAVVGSGVVLTSGNDRLDAPPAAPTAVPTAGPTAVTEPTPSAAPTAPVEGPEETSESDVGYVRGFGERDGRRTVLLDRVQPLQTPDSAVTTLVNDNARVREHVLDDDVAVVLDEGADRSVRTSGELVEVGSDSTLAALVAAHGALAEGEELLVALSLPDGAAVSAVVELALR